METIAIRQLTFDDFHTDEYRAFKPEEQPDYISLPTILDRLRDTLMELERQMEPGDHLLITLSVKRPMPESEEESTYGVLSRHLNLNYNSGKITFP